MIAAFRAEVLLLNRFRVWALSILVTVGFIVTATVLMITTAEPSTNADGLRLPGGTGGMPLEQLTGPGGATAAVSWAIYGYGFMLILTAFVSRIGNEFTGGTFRTALLHHPNRWSLIAGKMLALMTVTAALVVVGMASGAITSAVVAPGQDIDTAGWFGAEALRHTAVDFGQTMAWALGWALIATTLAVLVRSVPIALGIGLLWFGPIENVIGGTEQALALRWFPGLLLQQIVSAAPNPGSLASTSTAALTLAVYGLGLMAILAVFFTRLDVTS